LALYIPTDEILDALAPEIGIIAFHLGIELGLCAVDLERTWYIIIILSKCNLFLP
jgi:hypothetical protein